MRSNNKPASMLVVLVLMAASARAADTPVDRWLAAVGGRDKVAAINSLYREATIEVSGLKGTMKVWHTADGRYRKEERVATFSRIETFDGTTATVQIGDGPVQTLSGPDRQRAISSAFANTNAVFFACSPERHHGSIAWEGVDGVVLKPENGIEWHIVLDQQTSLPKVMTHAEGERTVTVTYAGYETVEGLQLEKEIHRTNGDPRFDAVIHFTDTIVNGPIAASLFSMP